MADGIIVHPGDIVQLTGSHQRGRVLDWATQLSIDRKAMSGSHAAVQPLDGSSTRFWPLNSITLIERHIQPNLPRLIDDFDVRF